MITKKTFILAAAQVKAILEGEWTHDAPAWVPQECIYGTEAQESDNNPRLGYYEGAPTDVESVNYTRAVQTAEAYMLLFIDDNPRFDQHRFLVACGLAVTPVKSKAKRSK